MREREIGDFVLLEEIGRGGMGVVYRARQKSLDRVVALKVLPSFSAVDPGSVVRFRREAAAAGRLNHPGIVPVHAVGVADGTHYFAMELVDGLSLHAIIDRLRGRRPSSLRRSLPVEAGLDGAFPELIEVARSSACANEYVASCAAIATQIASALGTAHRAGITHRDLKPGNVLLHGSGRPILVDFGLARSEGAMHLTRTGNMVGTPAYAAPEQALGNREADARVDVYGLGAVLYEMLALRPPFEGDSVAEVLQKLESEEPTSLRRINRRLPGDLDTIVRRCLAKSPDDRYPCVEALEDDLRSFLGGRAVCARRPTVARQVSRFVRRHRRVSVAAGVVLVIAALVSAWVGRVSATRARDEGFAALEDARRALVQGADLALARELYGRAGELLGDPDAVRRARRKHAAEAFERLYPRHLEMLTRLVSSLPPAERSELRHVEERLEGRGTIVLDSARRSGGPVEARIRALRDGELETRWRPLEPGTPLALGEYLIELRSEHGRAARVSVEVERDREVDLPAELVAVTPPPAGFVQVHRRDAEPFAIALHELTRGTYRRWLEGLDDPEVVAEMTPGESLDGDPELPVSGLSYAQARSVAAHLGAHLPTLEEYRAAVSAGLSGLSRPWGSAFDPDKLVADPNNRDGPEPVDGPTAVESPLGLRHAFGNVAEILSPGELGVPWMAGGHYHESNPRALDLSNPASLVAPLSGRTVQSRYAGVRLARYLGPLEPSPAAREVETVAKELLDRRPAVMLHDWAVRRDGMVDYAVTLAGFRAVEGGEARLELATPGFAQLGALDVRGGRGEVLRSRCARSANAEVADLTLWLPDARRGQRYVFSVETPLTPAGGLRGELSGFTMVVPIATTGAHDQLHTVRLPGACRIELVEPDPWRLFRTPNETHVVWRSAADNRGRFAPGRIRFQIDGMLGHSWPAERRAARTALDFLEALGDRDVHALRRMVHPAYGHGPGGLGRGELLRPGSISESRYSDAVLLDVTAVGPTVTLDLLADWTMAGSAGGDVVLRALPFRLELLREGDQLEILRFRPTARVDGGAVAGGAYRHERLDVELVPPDGSVVHRTMDRLTDLQVVITSTMDPAVSVQVLGAYRGEEESDDAVRMRLVLGDGDPRAAEPGESSWRARSGECWRAERRFVKRGRRHFSIQTAARGRDPDEAARRYDAGGEWFDTVIRGLRIE